MKNQILEELVTLFGEKRINELGFKNCTFEKLVAYLKLNRAYQKKELEKIINNGINLDEAFKEIILGKLDEHKKRKKAYDNFKESIEACFGEIPTPTSLGNSIGIGNQIDTNSLNFEPPTRKVDWYEKYTKLVKNFHENKMLNEEAKKAKEELEHLQNNIHTKDAEIKRLKPFEADSNKLKKTKEIQQFFIGFSILFLLSSILFFTKMSSAQKELTNIKDWYTSPDSVLAETYPFLRDSADFWIKLNALKEKSIAFEEINVDIDACVINPSNENNFNSSDTFRLFDKVYLARKFFIMENGNLMDDSQLQKTYLDSIPISFINTIMNFIDNGTISQDENYLSNVLTINREYNSNVFANLAYLAILDSTKQLMVRFPAYKEFEKERMKAYKFEDRPWSPFKYEKDTTYLTQPYGDIRNGLMPVRTYVKYYHKMYQGRKIKIAIGVDLIYSL